MYKSTNYSFASADPFLEELIDKRKAADQAPASFMYTSKPDEPKEQTQPPGSAGTTSPPSGRAKPYAPAPVAASSSSFDLRRVAAREAHQAELAGFMQRESQGYQVNPLSRRRADERLRNTLAGIDAETRTAERNEQAREQVYERFADTRARRESRMARAQANTAGALATGPSRAAPPQSTRTNPLVKPREPRTDGDYIGVPPGLNLTYSQLNLVGEDTLYGETPEGRKFYLNPGESPVYVDGQAATPSAPPRPREPAAPFVYQDPRRFTNETPEGRLRDAGVLTPTGELNLEATDYGQKMRLAEEKKRTDALYEQMLADDVARNPTNDPGLWDSSRRDPADPIGSARRSLRQTPQRQLMDLANFVPPLRYGSR